MAIVSVRPAAFTPVEAPRTARIETMAPAADPSATVQVPARSPVGTAAVDPFVWSENFDGESVLKNVK